MKVKYRFDVKGELNFPDTVAFDYKGRFYEFFQNSRGDVSAIEVSVQGDTDKHAPQVSKEQNGPYKANIIFKDNPHLEFIKMELRNLEGMLSVYGVSEIDVNNPTITWLPENEEEAEKIKIKQYKRGLSERGRRPELPMDLMAKAIIASYNALDTKIPLAFYRKGFSDFLERRFLECCFDFYFMFEALFAKGKFKTNQVGPLFRSSEILQTAIKDSVIDIDERERAALEKLSPEKYRKIVQGKSADEISDFFIKFRGDIHHYSSKDKKRWDPTDEGPYVFEANLFAVVANYLALNIIENKLFSDDVDIEQIRPMRKIVGDSSSH